MDFRNIQGSQTADAFRRQVEEQDIHTVLLKHNINKTERYKRLIEQILPSLRQHCFLTGWSPAIRATRQFTKKYTTLSEVMDYLFIYNVAESIIQATLIIMQEKGEVAVDFQADLENVNWK